MQKQAPFKLISILIVLATLLIPLTRQPVLAQGESSEAFLPDALGQDFWVVRVYFDTRAQVDQLAEWVEPWEVYYEAGYLVIGVSAADYNLLVAQGYRVEVDQELTTHYNQPRTYLPNQVTGIPGYPCYRTVEETYNTAADLATNYPLLAQWIDIGDSWEKTKPGGRPGYDLMVLRLTNETIGGNKPKLFIMTAIHAREYATAELNTRFAEYLIANYGSDPDITWLLDYTEIHLLLQSNPDGRKQAETGLSWRKNTNENYCSPTSTSRGADLNRNFEFEWGCCVGSSGAECDATYRGPSPASEPETQAIQSYVRAIFPDQRGSDLTDPAPDDATGIFLDIHSYGRLMLWPWGFTYTIPPNGTQLQTLGRKLAYFNNYAPEQARYLYPTDGTTDDFAYGDLGLAAYTFELGTTFFQSCASFENTILPNNLPALIYAAKAARTPYLTPAGPDALEVTATPNQVIAGNLVMLTATLNDTRFNHQNGNEPDQDIAAAAYYIDTPPWATGATAHDMEAVDGEFSTSIEDVIATINTTGLSDGRHTIFVRGQDALDNWGAVSAVFIEVVPTDPPEASFISSSPDVLGATTIFTNTSDGSDLSYAWDFGDMSAADHRANPTHSYASTGAFTVTLTITEGLLADTYSDQVQIYDPQIAQILLDKDASTPEVIPGESLTYTLDAYVILSGTNTFSVNLTDTLPAQISVLPESIQVNGLPTPGIYFTNTHTIQYQEAGAFTDTYQIEITFQARVGDEVPPGTRITNQFDGRTTINGDPNILPKTVKTTILVVPPTHQTFLPMLIR